MQINEKTLEEMIDYAKSFINCPYVYGANGPDAFDCSGFCLQILKKFDLFPADVDVTAQDIYFYLSGKNWVQKHKRGAFCFFGKNREKITHIGILIDEKYFIGANGGDKTTTNIEIAKKQNAKVDIRPIRKDLVGVLYPIK